MEQLTAKLLLATSQQQPVDGLQPMLPATPLDHASETGDSVPLVPSEIMCGASSCRAACQRGEITLCNSLIIYLCFDKTSFWGLIQMSVASCSCSWCASWHRMVDSTHAANLMASELYVSQQASLDTKIIMGMHVS